MGQPHFGHSTGRSASSIVVLLHQGQSGAGQKSRFNILHACGEKRFKHRYLTVLWGFITTKKDPTKTILHVPLPNAEFDYLAMMRGTRKWSHFFRDIQDDARKAAKANQELRERVEFLEDQARRGG